MDDVSDSKVEAPEVEGEDELEAEVEAEDEDEAEPEIEVEDDGEPEAESEVEPEAESDGESEAEPEVEPEAEVESEAEPSEVKSSAAPTEPARPETLASTAMFFVVLAILALCRVMSWLVCIDTGNPRFRVRVQYELAPPEAGKLRGRVPSRRRHQE